MSLRVRKIIIIVIMRLCSRFLYYIGISYVLYLLYFLVSLINCMNEKFLVLFYFIYLFPDLCSSKKILCSMFLTNDYLNKKKNYSMIFLLLFDVLSCSWSHMYRKSVCKYFLRKFGNLVIHTTLWKSGTEKLWKRDPCFNFSASHCQTAHRISFLHDWWFFFVNCLYYTKGKHTLVQFITN